MNKDHQWKAEIIAFLNGEEVQGRYNISNTWKKVDDLSEFTDDTYIFRIKPPIVYPETKMTGAELDKIWSETPACKGGHEAVYDAHIAIANAAIRCAIEDGQVKLP